MDAHQRRRPPGPPLLGERLPAAAPCWQGPVEPVLAPWLPDHRVGGAIVWPGTGYVEMALAAGRRALGGPAEVVRLDLTRMLVVDWANATDVRLQTSVAQRDGAIDITSTRTGADTGDAPSPPRQHARGRVRTLQGRAPDPIDIPAVRERCGRRVDREQHYQACEQAGLSYGPAFQVLEELWAGAGEVLAAYRHTHPTAGSAAGLEVHPALLDGALQAGAPLLAAHAAAGPTFLPAKFGAVRVWRAPSAQGWVHVRDRTLMADEKCWDITVTDPDGTVTAELRGVRLRRLPGRDPSTVQTYRTVMRAAPHEHRPAAPSPLPSPERLAAGAADQIDRLRSAWHGFDYERARQESTAMLAHVTRDLIAGLLDDATAPFTLADLTDGRTAPWLGRWAALALPLMRDHDLAAQLEAPAGAPPGKPPVARNERWRLLPDDARMADLWRESVEGQPAWISHIAPGAHLMRNLPAILDGERDPLQMLLDGGAAEQLRRFYDLHPVCRFHNRVARALLEQIVAAWPADRPLRILEVGAGTGGLTAALLPVLPPERARYTFTDVSAFFLDGAQQRFTGYDFLDYRTFDLDADPAPQGFTPGGYDLLVAGNALHTGTEIRAALRRAAALLAPGGHLLAFEYHAPTMLLPLFGTLDSFWAAAGDPDRDAAVMIDRERWPALLRDCGFPDLVQTGDDRGPAAADASVLLARTAADAAPAAEPSPEAVPSARGRHVVVAETTGELPLARATAALLDRHGAAAVRAAHAAQAGTDPALWEALLRGDDDGDHGDHGDHGGPVTVTLLLGDPDTPPAASGDGPGAQAVEQTVRRAAILRAIALAYRRIPERTGRSLVLVTRPSGALPAPERPVAPTDAAVWGLVRTLANEHTTVDTRRISLERTTPAADAAVAADAHRLVLELLAPGGEDGAEEDEVALTANGRFVPREVPYGPRTVPAAEGDSFRIEVRGGGLSYRLAWTEADPPGPPGPGAVTVAVRAAALNYRDIMQATGLLPAEAIEGGLTQDGVGFEFAGTVTAVGEGVAGLAAGDRVAGFASGALASSLTTHAGAVFPVPDGTSLAGAATMPVAFATVHHALETVARLREGETVLVHGGAGAVGLAVVQHARLRGARVIATAGSDIKRDLLRCLGVRHVFNSRTLDFAADVTRATGGRGVDVVVNSLAGEGLTRSTELLAPGGRFIELGKRDLVEDGSLPLHPLSGNALFAVVDLSTLLHRPAEAEALFEDVAEHVRAGRYRPLPHTVFPAARVAEAFECLQHSRHIGKVIVELDPSDDPIPVERRPAPPRLDPDGAYLVTGGLSGFGAATARHLADRGARRLALVSRRGGDAPGASALVSALAERGVEATVHAADCGDAAAIARIVEQIDRAHTDGSGGSGGDGSGHRLRGVVHAAMHLDDEALTDLPDERLAAVLVPKMAGTLVLDALTRDRDLELFCVYSSMAACVGNVRQSAYVAGNLFMEALVRRRRGDGAAGLAVAWGAISDTGYVDRNDLGAFLGSLGLEGITSVQALATLDELAAAGADVASAGHMSWGTAGKFFRVVRAPRCGRLVPAGHDGGRATERLRSELAALPSGQALAAIADELAGRIGAVLHIDPDRLDRNRRLDEYGLDSLMAAELITSLGDLFDLDISPMELLNRGGTIAGLAQFVQEQIALARPPSGAGPPPPGPRAGGLPGGPHVPDPADPNGSGDADAMPTSTTAGTPT
ncbi:SDR family NAD(P)-dependent oxidoreductase [Actinomadura yumaensis]|uniref:SDR family NAD(P)-dependent oxidoreductase n=1 Tax=Actinomadura yumaensis TaxID=111807 RepID=UPI003609FB56